MIGVLAAILIPTFASIIRKANAKSALSDAKNTLTSYLSEVVTNTDLPEQIVIFTEKGNHWYVYGYDGLSHEKQLVESPANPISGDFDSLESLILANNAASATDFASGKLFYIYPLGSGYNELTAHIACNTRVFHGILFEGDVVAVAPTPTPTPTPLPTSGFTVSLNGEIERFDTITEAWAYATDDNAATSSSNRAIVKIYEDAAITEPLVLHHSIISVNTKNITLDLNSHTIDRGLSESPAQDNGHVISVQEMTDLIITDLSASRSGKIAGGNNTTGAGGISVMGRFTLVAGEISGNKTEESGGGIWCLSSGKFYMTGGTIDGNSAESSGGGVFATTVYITGGSVTNNTAGNSGGGINCISTINGAQISGNVVISGNTVGGNTGNLKSMAPLVIQSELLNAQIGITSHLAPTEGNPIEIGTGGNNIGSSTLFSDDNRYEIQISGDTIYLALAQP